MVALVLIVDATKWNQLKNYNFEKYVEEFNKNYSGKEYEQRKAIFEARLERIMEHNSNPLATYKKGVNHLSDRTDEVKAIFR